MKVQQPPDFRPDQIPRSRRSADWEDLEIAVLSRFRRSEPAAPERLIVVHPRDAVLKAAVATLDADDWNPSAPLPYMRRFEWRGVTWTVIEETFELKAIRARA